MEIDGRNELATSEARRRGFRVFDIVPISRRLGVAGLGPDHLHPAQAQYDRWADEIWEAVGPDWVAAGSPSVAFGELGHHLDYGSYLRIPELLQLQTPRTEHHDEVLFIVIHQAFELWFKLQLREMEAARDALLAGDATGAAGICAGSPRSEACWSIRSGCSTPWHRRISCAFAPS